MQPPEGKSYKAAKHPRRFLGMENYNRDMWKQRMHIVAPSNIIQKRILGNDGTACAEITHTISKEMQLNLLDFKDRIQMQIKAIKYQLKCGISAQK